MITSSSLIFDYRILNNFTGILTVSHRILLNIFSSYTDVFEQALSGMCSSLLHRVFGTQSKDCHIFQREQ